MKSADVEDSFLLTNLPSKNFLSGGVRGGGGWKVTFSTPFPPGSALGANPISDSAYI